MAKEQKPSIGRIVHYNDDAYTWQTWQGREPDNWLAAIICRVHSDTTVNLSVFDANGNTMPRTLVEMGDGRYQWRWPPRV